MKASCSIISNCELQTHQGELDHVVKEGDHVLLVNEILHAENKMLGLSVLFPHTAQNSQSHRFFRTSLLLTIPGNEIFGYGLIDCYPYSC